MSFTAKQDVARSVRNGFVPIGACLFWKGANSLPEGYLHCNGLPVRTEDYPELAKYYGAEAQTMFNIITRDQYIQRAE